MGLISCLSEEGLLQFGKHPGKTNLTDVDSALNVMRYLDARPAVMIMKHNNPSGASYGSCAAEAYERANAADRLAAFGGAAVFNVTVDREAAERLAANYLEVVAAPDYEGAALEIFRKKEKSPRHSHRSSGSHPRVCASALCGFQVPAGRRFLSSSNPSSTASRLRRRCCPRKRKPATVPSSGYSGNQMSGKSPICFSAGRWSRA